MSWTRRIRRPSGQALEEAHSAARNLADHVAPGKARVAFETVADVAIIGSVVIGGALGLVHLFKALCPRHKQEHTGPEPAGSDRSPPRRPGPHAIAAGDYRGGYEGDGSRSR